MTPEAQRIAIAVACGWVRRADLDYVSGNEWRCVWAWEGYCTHALPDYLNDLNAMAEALTILNDRQKEEFAHYLFEIVQRDTDPLGPTDVPISKPSRYIGWLEESAASAFNTYTATAAQRAEALLRTLGKWEEGK